jgi:hypothetical protein
MLLRLIRTDGEIISMTSYDIDLTIDSIVYYCSPGFSISNIEASSDMETDNLNVNIPFDTTLFLRSDVLGERYTDASFDLYFIDPTNLTFAENILTGILGEIKCYDEYVEIELLSTVERLNYDVGWRVSPKCRYRFGDKYCRVNIQEVMSVGVVRTVTTNSVFTAYIADIPIYDATLPSPYKNSDPYKEKWNVVNSEWFTYGTIHMNLAVQTLGVAATLLGNMGGDSFTTSMENHKMTRMLRSFTADGSGVITITLVKSFPFTVVPGDTFFISPGCDKSVKICHSRFSNEINFGAEPKLPGKDRVTATTGS